jgi:hypothetical protein
MVSGKIRERKAARALRRDGLSLREIARRLGVSLSSASVWTRDIRPRNGLPTEPSAPPDSTRSTTLALCGRCCQMLPLADFHFSRGRRQTWCKACRADYMRQRGELHRRETRAAREHRRAEARRFVLELLRGGSCADCGVADPVVLEFDHLGGGKTADVARLVHEGYRLAGVKAEVATCEIVCVNCHRRRTAKRARTWRTDPKRVASNDRPLRRRNLRFVLEHLRTANCSDWRRDRLSRVGLRSPRRQARKRHGLGNQRALDQLAGARDRRL